VSCCLRQGLFSAQYQLHPQSTADCATGLFGPEGPILRSHLVQFLLRSQPILLCVTILVAALFPITPRKAFNLFTRRECWLGCRCSFNFLSSCLSRLRGCISLHSICHRNLLRWIGRQQTGHRLQDTKIMLECDAQHCRGFPFTQHAELYKVIRPLKTDLRAATSGDLRSYDRKNGVWNLCTFGQVNSRCPSSSWGR
jgi:hypothetical protein